MNHSCRKIFLWVAIAGSLLAGLALPARPAKAVWSNVPSDIVISIAQVFTEQELHDAIAEAAKAWAMQRWQKIVMNLVSKNGGFIWNYGEYIYGSGNNAAAKYWNAFLQNCTNISPAASLSIQANVVGGTNTGVGYDWCPVRVNVRGVNLQANVNLSTDFGWEDFGDQVANSSYRQFLQLSGQVEEARQKAENIKMVEAMSSGLKPQTQAATNGNSAAAAAAGMPSATSIAASEEVKVPVQSFSSMINAATGGIVQVTAADKSMIASFLTTTLLNYASDQLLNVYEQNGGNYGEYLQ